LATVLNVYDIEVFGTCICMVSFFVFVIRVPKCIKIRI